LGYVHNEKQVAEDMYVFLTTFFTTYPQYQPLPFFITGESYGGHYVPAVATMVQSENKSGAKIQMKLMGASIGNGWVDPGVQTGSYAPFLFYHNLINQATVNKANQQNQECVNDINKGNYGKAFFDCNQVLNIVLSDAGNINIYNIDLPCTYPPLCYNFNPISDYLNQDSVREQLGVGDRTWSTCSNVVYAPFEASDFETSYRTDIPTLLADYRVLLYNGDLDLMCNFYGTSALLSQMPWSGQTAFNSAANTTWTGPDGQPAGSFRTAEGLTYIVVYNAGHMVPHDQPENALNMINRFLFNQTFA